jgi:hypothetical protein
MNLDDLVMRQREATLCRYVMTDDGVMGQIRKKVCVVNASPQRYTHTLGI